MPTVINAPPGAPDSMIGHSWFVDDQQVAFAVPPFVAGAVSVSAYLSPWLINAGHNSQNLRPGICIRDEQVTVCLMNQALEFLQRAICNTVGHYILAQRGLETWARVTNYYASYFSVHSLLCLQGRTITSLELGNSRLLVQIVPLDLRNHVFYITGRNLGRNPHHETPWNRFYDIYDKYAVSHPAYELVARKAFITEPADESIERNTINYMPFRGFTEIRDLQRHGEFSVRFSDYVSDLEAKNSLQEFLTDLQGYASDPEHKYFARTLLKIAFAGDIISSIRVVSGPLEVEWTAMREKWGQFLEAIFRDPNTCYLLKFVPLIGTALN